MADDCLSFRGQAAFTRTRWNALIQRMAEEESGAWGCVDNRDVIVRLTGQQTDQAVYLVSSSMLTLDRWLRGGAVAFEQCRRSFGKL